MNNRGMAPSHALLVNEPISSPAAWFSRALCILQPAFTLTGQVIGYGAMGTQEAYLGKGRVEIDNNRVDNDIRPGAIGNRYAEFMIRRSC